MPYDVSNNSLPSPISFAQVGAFVPDTTYEISTPNQTIDLDVSAFAMVTLAYTGSITVPSAFPFDITITVGLDASLLFSRTLFSLKQQSIVPGGILGNGATSDLLYIPVLGVNLLRIEAASDFDGDVFVTVHMASGPGIVDLAGAVGLNNVQQAYSRLVFDVPQVPCSSDGKPLSLKVHPTVLNGNASDAREPQRTHIAQVCLTAVTITNETAIVSPSSFLPFFYNIWRLIGYSLSCDTPGDVLLRDGMGGATIEVVPFTGALHPVVAHFPNGIASTYDPTNILGPATNQLTAQGPAGAKISGTLRIQQGAADGVGPTFLTIGF